MSTELSLEAALASLRARIVPVAERATIPAPAALGRVLASDIASMLDLPAFDCAAMDGYAVVAQACVPGQAQAVMGTALAGHPFAGRLQPGQAVRIMTGAPLPAGADAVVMSEDAQCGADSMSALRAVAAGDHVRRRGEHVAAGSRVLARGRRLRAEDLGLAASVGAASVEVFRRLRIGVLSTGDELADAPALLAAGGAFDGNRPMLLALAASNGHEAIDLGICADAPDAFQCALQRARSLALDVLLTTGGAAQGDADIVRRFGSPEFIAVDFRPGRGIAFAQPAPEEAATVLLGLPGNAVAAYVMYQLLARPLLAHLAGAQDKPMLRLRLPLSADARVRAGRIDWRRARLVEASGTLTVELLADQGSAMLRTVSEADALAAIGPEPFTAAGAIVDAIPLKALG